MATHAQWRRSADKGEVRKTTWVCGDQRVLVEEVVDFIRRQLGVSDMDYVCLTAGTVADRDIWAAAGQYPMDPTANRLILIRDAEKIRNWEPLTEWLAGARRLPTVHLLFVSNLPDFGADKKMPSHVEAIKARGHIVRCAMPNETDALAWVKRRANLDDETARHLLTRTGGNLALAGAVCAKLSLFDGQAGPRTINQLCAEVPADSFVESLLLLNKRAALHAAESLRPNDFGKIIGLLDSRLDLLAVLHRAVRAGYSTREVQGFPLFLVKQFMSVAKHYDPKRCLYSRRVLAVIDDVHRSGARDGLMTALTALW